ncbi:MAG: YggT family protein [Acholeplasmataceae bacterium]|jgi:YggT family protein|nr:YggT family protein [Acholeplasmataceae bacterium]
MIFKLIIEILYIIFAIYGGLLSLAIILSWVPGIYDIAFFRNVGKIADWYLGPFRGRLVIGTIDLSPMIGLIIYGFILSLLRI